MYSDLERFLRIGWYAQYGETWSHLTEALPYREENTTPNGMKNVGGAGLGQ
jgi:hypothetical protein